MTELMTFSVGQMLKPLADRPLPGGETEVVVAHVYDHRELIPGVSHRYSIEGTNGHTYSGWWFDPAAQTVMSGAFDDSTWEYA